MFSSEQKQQLQAKLQQLTTNVRLENNVLKVGNQSFSLPKTSKNQEIYSKTTTSR